MNIILIGIQGSGKGTQAKLLTKKYGWKHITTGEIFRENINQKTNLGLQAKSYIEKGELVPDSIVYEIVSDAIQKANNGFILDGFPRNLEQTEFLLENFKIDKVVLLELSDEKAIERVMARVNCDSCGKDYNLLFSKPKNDGICDNCGGKIVRRKDDNEIAIKKRIEKFHLETEKAIDYFTEKKLVVKIDVSKGINEILSEIIAKIEQ
ncbi:MAG: nucleoside monophosphate kinase [Candidatus Cloacimonetes bacterium]|jgi:adenylate kinase|nr:nucleoside monophosphate kinase [Candidatus Cloacimonadota bacterium]MBT6994407.1 nucleoside monophosphate kinase [Candidatus Cloacimonadota bacterium]MBT7469570.1 nucleoside monophosphate kinase [Candidatus Cloacimonadota bacterium]